MRGPLHPLGADQGGHVLEADPNAGEPAYSAAPSGDGVPPPEELVLRVNEMQHQLQYASMVRANYEKQLHQLSSALQTERITKGEHPAPRGPPVLQLGGSLWPSTCVCVWCARAVCAAHVPAQLRWLQGCAKCLYGRERAGENNLRVHELSEQVHELSKAKQELHDQVEHWRSRAQEALEQKALDVMNRDQGQATSAIEDILLDIKKLQQVCLSACSCVNVVRAD